MDDTSTCGESQVHLQWHQHESNLVEVFEKLFREETFADVTLVCQQEEAILDEKDDSRNNLGREGHHFSNGSRSVKAHKILLSASSPLFERILKNHPCHHPVVILPDDIVMPNLMLVLEFIYKGEVDVPKERLDPVLETAELLLVKGLQGGLDSTKSPTSFSRESSVELPMSSLESRPSSRLSSSRRKSSPKFRFTKSKRKTQKPIKFNENSGENGHASVPSDPGEEEVPMDFTMKNGHQDVEMKPETEPEPNHKRILNPSQFTFPTSRNSNGHILTPPTLVSRQSVNPYYYPSLVKSLCSKKSLESENVEGLKEDNLDLESSATGFLHKAYTKKEMGLALNALKEKKMTLTRASEQYGIPATTLWQRANRLGISTPKKETTNKSWSEIDLNRALNALRNKEISANKAAKTYGIPSSTLYKIARKERIELAQPFNAVQTSWSQEDLDKALAAIRKGMAVQKAATEYGIPSGTLYGRCKKAQIELSKTTAVHWSEDDMQNALESVRQGRMSINQAAIHHNLPYSSLYGRIGRLKREQPEDWDGFSPESSGLDGLMTRSTNDPPIPNPPITFASNPFHSLPFMTNSNSINAPRIIPQILDRLPELSVASSSASTLLSVPTLGENKDK